MSYAGRGGGGRRLRWVLDEREEALATLLERVDAAQALRRSCDGKPARLKQARPRGCPVMQVRLQGGLPGEVLDIRMRGSRCAAVERVWYRCLAISGRDRIEVTPRDFSATWHMAQVVAAHRAGSMRPKLRMCV